MTIKIDQLKKLAEGQGLKYFLAPDRPALLMGFAGVTGSYQVLMLVELDGRFLQFRTTGYGQCPMGHPNLEAVLRVIGDLDYRFRLAKFGWDPSDGEIVGYADLWLEDATLTPRQFAGMLGAFLPAIDLAHARIGMTLATGVDPEGKTGPGTGTPNSPGTGGTPTTPNLSTV